MIEVKYLKATNTFVRFVMVGAVNTAAGLFIMLTLLNLIGVSYWLSTFIGNSAGAILSYFLNRSFTFRSSVGLTKAAPRFIAVILTCYVFSYWASSKLVALEFANFLPARLHNDAAVLIGSGIYTISNYLGQKKFVFK
ncbi:polysaccharide biosynthesis protein GtrA [Bacillus sp. FJAT-27225]|uniref:GtrA family protein n=1 Tax=Bacillus sp. FJAT-27225 TaxID=1743144 RepID=UPI00080C243C|nr:GtrA family protein [Bacillus sp. FJAT-27225]OCA87567.1 polysaccharide biosynthesis protein GtrA [Bacillus sp. FJAT-27225]